MRTAMNEYRAGGKAGSRMRFASGYTLYSTEAFPNGYKFDAVYSHALPERTYTMVELV